jgi:hypothetical protein
MFDHILCPLGVEGPPDSLETAIGSYVVARDRLEREFGVTVPRTLEREVARLLDSNGDSPVL